MKIVLFFLFFQFPFTNYIQNSANRFYPLKEWKLNKDGYEVSYPLTNGTTYNIDFVNSKSGRFTLYNRKREVLLTQEINGNSIIWKNTKTEICYLRFEGITDGIVKIGFNRLDIQTGTQLK